ncbi:MAG: MATE family efflux transporter [Lachnospiraceae bacterium]|nr:MATE family efflux transporter [Lachnospiraceae bacterium]
MPADTINKNTKLTEGNIFKNLLLFAMPMMAGNFLQQIYNIADTLIAGRYIGTDALAAAGSAYTLMTFINSIIIGLCMGSGALFSKWYGAGKLQEMQQDVQLSFYFIGTVTLLIYLVVFPGTDIILRMVSVPDNIYSLMRTYVKIIFIGTGFIFLYNFFAYLLRSAGNSVVPLCFLAISSIINIALDLYFVISLKKGIPGTAAATVISQGFAGIGITLYTIWKYPEFIRFHGRLQWTRLEIIIKNDIFTGMQQSVMNFGILMIQGLINSFGTTIMAAFAAAVKIDTLAYMPAQEFGNAYSLFISQNYGAGKNERIQKGTKTAAIVSVTFCLFISVIIWIFSSQFMYMFVDAKETAIISEGVKYLRIEGTFYFGIGCLFLLYGYFRGIQKSGISLILTIISLGTRVLLSYTLAPNTPLGVTAIWWSIPIGWILADITGILIKHKCSIERQ